MAEAVRVFFSYSHKDEEWRDRLAEHLSILKRKGVISEWHDRQIGAGTEWAREIDTQLNNADIILLLISASFLNSDYCWGVELEQAMKRHEAGDACVIPVILRPVDWKDAPFSKLQAFPKDAKAITTWIDKDEALMNVAAGIRQAAEQLQAVRQQNKGKLIPAPDDRATQQARETGQEETLYRQDVQNCLHEDGGELSPISRVFLDGLRDSLNLSPDQAAAIELQLLKPYQNYAQTFERMVQQEYPLSVTNQNRLKLLQQRLALTDEAVKAIESRILADELASERGIDYTKLRDLLIAGNWREADYETYLVMLQAVGRTEEDWIRPEELQKFPCTDLRTIDSLWVKYSNEHFGFSIQKKIWQECGSPTSSGKEWDCFCARVGWQNKEATAYVSYKDLQFNLQKSPRGELPSIVLGVIERLLELRLEVFEISSRAQRVAYCNIQ